MKSILSVAEAYAKMSEDAQNLASTNAAETQKKQEDQPEIPAWVPGDLPDNKKKEFVEAVKKAWESDNTQFDFDGRTYKITEKEELKGDQHKLDVDGDGKIEGDDLAALRRGEKPETTKEGLEDACWKGYEAIGTKQKNGRTVPNCVPKEELKGDQHKLDVDGDGKIEADDLAALRAGKKVEEDHMENETETPGQTQYPGSEMPAPEGDEEDDEGLEESVRLKKMQDMMRVTHGAMSRDEYKKKWAHLKKPKNKLAGPGGLYKNLVKEGEENPTDKLTIDVPAMIRALEKSREDFKSDADIHNFVQDLLKKKDQEVKTNDLPGEPVKEDTENVAEAKDYHAAALAASEHAKKQPSATTHKAASDAHEKAIAWHERKINALIKKDGSADEVKKHEDHIKMHKNEGQKHRFNAHRLGKSQKNESTEVVAEKLDPNDDAGVWISDFVNSTDPKFDGKSKEERKQQALAAWYAARREAGIKEEVMNEATAGELGKKAHALSSAANTAKDHKAAANAHYKAAEAFRRHTTANAAKTGKKADDAHDAALKHEELGDKHLEKAMTKKESTQITENVAGDARAVDLTTAANQASALAHSAPAEAGALMHHDAATKAHQHAADHYRVYAHHAGDPELRRAAEIHHKFHSDMAQHHTLKGVSLSVSEQTVNEALKHDENISKKAHDLSAAAKKSNTPSDHLEAMKAHNAAQLHHAKLYHSAAQKKDSAAKDLHAKAYHDHKMAADIHHDTAQFVAVTKGSVKEGTSADAKGGPEVMDVATKKMKDDADKNVKAEEAPYTNKADGSEEVTPAEKPKANPSPMPTLTKEQALRSVADTYSAMVK